MWFKSVRDDIRKDECDDTIDENNKIKPLALTLVDKWSKNRPPENIAELN